MILRSHGLNASLFVLIRQKVTGQILFSLHATIGEEITVPVSFSVKCQQGQYSPVLVHKCNLEGLRRFFRVKCCRNKQYSCCLR
ncbi:hypothetical protein MA16_Dca027651 [Dendrobium catenatum]|uniref:Uncharacterized protein n=1 Tax=Dendrobium catenatum TaxID=906689 RepID=A0A2I0V8S0_9ASPA|nr:hypothetical protein MA16_Dca027651 [Dendrobium catenatum]